MVNFVDLIGVRYKSHGRSNKDGYDCYGLVIEVEKRLGHNLVDIDYEVSGEETLMENTSEMLRQLRAYTEETDEQEFGNIILFLENGKAVHIGVILEDGKFIHCDCFGVRVCQLENYFRKNWKVYKWRQ